MRVASLPRFLPSVICSRAFVFAMLVVLAMVALLAFDAVDVSATPIPVPDPQHPFRWA
jgi:hypothetical protein